MLTQAVKLYRRFHPGEPVDIGLIKNSTIRMLLRGLDQYDPRFGAAFYDGSWNAGFDHAHALAAIACPVLLMHAHTALLPDGTLNGAMSDADAARARALLRHGTFVKVDAGHVVNLEQPALFVRALQDFFVERPLSSELPAPRTHVDLRTPS